MKKIIAIGGRIGHGKDTAAVILADALRASGRTVRVVAFADALKDMLTAMYSLDARTFSDRALKETPIAGLGFTPRAFMQVCGAAMRDAWRDLTRTIPRERLPMAVALGPWISALHQRMSDFAEDFVVVTDVRYEDEAAWLRCHGARMYFIDAGLRVRSDDSHSSEKLGYSHFDETIFNNGALEEFALAVRGVAAQVA